MEDRETWLGHVSAVSRWANARTQFREHLTLLVIARDDHTPHISLPQELELLADHRAHRLVFDICQWHQLAYGFGRRFNTACTTEASLNLVDEIALFVGTDDQHAQGASASEPIPDACFVLSFSHQGSLPHPRTGAYLASRVGERENYNRPVFGPDLSPLCARGRDCLPIAMAARNLSARRVRKDFVQANWIARDRVDDLAVPQDWGRAGELAETGRLNSHFKVVARDRPVMLWRLLYP